MERKIGEIFEYEGKILRVKEVEGKICKGCLFLNKCTCETKGIVGWCGCGTRSDKKNVIFVEVKEQQELETVKERKIGEKFDYYGKTLEVVETKSDTCYQCCFKEETGRCSRIKSKTGVCDAHKRSDRRPVIFVEVKNETKEQPHQKLNLCDILKNCPKGTELWSDNYGTVKFMRVGTEWDTPIEVELSNGQLAYYTEEGRWDKRFPASCLLYPSKDCRDWSKFSAPWLKKEKFDPKTLNAFDKVIARKDSEDSWNIDFFSCFKLTKIPLCLGGIKCAAIPYNDDTKHLVGTTDDAPEFYRYWED